MIQQMDTHSFQMQDGIETPILVKEGIECKPLLLNTAGKKNLAFLLDNVSAEWAEKLPAESFLKLSPQRYITTKPIESNTWETIFPGVKTQYTQPSEMEAPTVGKTIPIPPEVQDKIQALSDEQIRSLISASGDTTYVASYDECRFAAKQGQIEKSYVGVILEAVTKSILDDQPHVLHLIAFLNSVYEHQGRNERVTIDTIKVFDQLCSNESYDNHSITGALPNYLAKTARLGCFINLGEYQVIIFNTSSKTISVQNFASAGQCFRYCYDEGFIKECDISFVEVLEDHIKDMKSSWPIKYDWHELVGQISSDQSVFEYQGERFLVLDEGKSEPQIQYADSQLRLVFVLSKDSCNSFRVNVENWLDHLSVRDKSLEYLIWGSLGASVDEKLIQSGIRYDLEILPVKGKWESISDRRRLIDIHFFSPLYDFSAEGLNLAKRVLLDTLYNMVAGSFISNSQDLSSTERFLGALSFITDLVKSLTGETILQLGNDVRLAFISVGILPVQNKLLLAKSLTATSGAMLAKDLQCNTTATKQYLTRLLTDIAYQRTLLEPKMGMNWPSEQKWWQAGFTIQMNDSGWYVERNNRFVLKGYQSKEAVLDALKAHVIDLNIRLVGDRLSYVSPKWLSYKLPTNEKADIVPSALVSLAIQQRPDKRNPTWFQGENLIESFVNNFESDLPADYTKYFSGAFEQLLNIVGIDKTVLNLGGSLSIHVTGTELTPEIALWHDSSMTCCGIGGLAYAWGSMFYDFHTAGRTRSKELYFPTVESSELQALFYGLLYREKPLSIKPELFEFEQIIKEEIKEKFNIKVSELIVQMERKAFEELVATLYSIDEHGSKEITSGLYQIRDNCHFPQGKTQQVFNQYVKHSMELAADQKCIELVQGRSLFARAFEAWVEDCLKLANQENHFLVYGTQNEERMGANLYPTGLERFQQRQAFQEYLDAAK